MGYRLRVYGPPGCGKTTFLLNTVQSEIEHGIHPCNVTFCSFTRAASYHGKDLAMEKFPEYSTEDFENFSTVHSIAYRLLDRPKIFQGKARMEFAKKYGYEYGSEAQDDMAQALQDYSLETRADCYEAFISWAKNRMVWGQPGALKDFSNLYGEDVPDEFTSAGCLKYIERRERFKQDNNLWDFADLLIGVLNRGLVPPCDVFLLDEGQDSSKLILAVAEQFAARAQRSYWASDPYQALYQFSGAEPEYLINMKADETETLKQSYRCPRKIHDISRQIVGRMKVRYENDDFIPRDEEGVIDRQSLSLLDFKPGVTTFYAARTRYLLDDVYERLVHDGIPFYSRRGKQSPLQKPGARVFHTLCELMDGERVSIAEIAAVAEEIPQKVWMERGTRTKLKDMGIWAMPVTKSSLPDLGFTPEFMSHLNDHCIGDILKTDDLRYLEMVRRKGRELLVKKPDVQVGTIHSLKGLEADEVFYNLDLTNKPYQTLIGRNADSEHRVAFVATTRTKKRLVLTSDDWRAYPL